MKIRKPSALAALVLSGALALSACSGGGRDGTSDAGGSDSKVVGVSLPWLGTQNWKEAQTMFKEELTAAGFDPIIQAADNKVPQQQSQVESMIEQGAKVIVLAPIDGTQMSSVVEKAKAAGITVLGYDRMIENTDAVDGVVQYGSLRTGELQGQSLLEGLAALKGSGPYNIELFAGGPADPNATLFFQGAMKVLQPKIDDGTLTIVSGQADFQQVATQDWDAAKAQTRMDSLLSGNYASGTVLHGVLSPNDGIARAILTSSEQQGLTDLPVVTGLDAENESVTSIWAGKQYSTVAKPTDKLVARTMELITLVTEGSKLPAGDEMVDNGKKDVAVYQLDPIIVTKENAKEVFADDPSRMALLK